MRRIDGNEKNLIQDEDEEKPGEEFHYIEKHVEFTDDLPDDEEKTTKDQQTQKRLIRKNTPHHLKDKRIISKNNDTIAFEVNQRMEISFSETVFFFSSK